MTNRARSAVLALGSNLGDRGSILQGCVDAIAGIPEVRVMAVSPVYETVPVGGPPQPDYLNAVLLARTTLPSRALLDRLHEVEAAFDRVRDVRWGPRTIDIDIVAVEGEASDDPELTLPHPRAHERTFVLAPWHDVDPDAVVPGHGPVAALLAAADTSGIRRSTATLVIPQPGAGPGVPRPGASPGVPRPGAGPGVPRPGAGPSIPRPGPEEEA
jgi:2-amino-4-hydroxy-6-hydroxymethyldihydropteridine diphosphokinase